jgi:hypothetical protein
MMHETEPPALGEAIFAGLRAFWQTVTAAIAEAYQAQGAAADGLPGMGGGTETPDVAGIGAAHLPPGGGHIGPPGGLA